MVSVVWSVVWSVVCVVVAVAVAVAVVVVVLVVCVCVRCGVARCKPLCVDSKRARVYYQNVPVKAGTTRTC